jgi:micrococcal nuclease
VTGNKKRRYAISTKQRRTIIVFVILIVTLVVWLDNRSGSLLRDKIITKTSLAADPTKYHLRSFRVTNVVDGDTIDISVSDGKYEYTRIRLLGVDTPETKNPRQDVMYFGPEASEFVAKTVLNKNIKVILDEPGPTRDKYNRLLAYIELPDGNILNELIIKNGFGYADLRFSHSDFDSYENTMNKALEQKTGLWKNVKKGQLPAWLRNERPNLLD